MTTEHCLAVLGCRDEPTDAVEEYCQYLAKALVKHGIELKLARLGWSEDGWAKALGDLRQQIEESGAKWVLVQYTALAWSRRGFPMRVGGIIKAAKDSGARCAFVFHDPVAYPGERYIDAARRTVQLRVMRRILESADLSVLTIPKETISWLPKKARTIRFIPVGANLPHPESVWEVREKSGREIRTIAVFAVNGGAAGDREIGEIVEALRLVESQIGAVRLTVFGRNSESAGPKLKRQLKNTRVEVAIHGLVSAEEVEEILGNSDVMLFVRGPISTRRGSALAGIACGLPVVAYGGWETAGPVTEAGVVLVEQGSGVAAGEAIVRILQDEAYRHELRKRSRRAQEQFFSWDAIAAAYATALDG